MTSSSVTCSRLANRAPAAPARRRRSPDGPPQTSSPIGSKGWHDVMKQLINRVEDAVKGGVGGVLAPPPPAGGGVRSDPNWGVRADARIGGRAAPAPGGGSGQEPMQGGFVG